MEGSPYFDTLETRAPDEREAELFANLRALLAKLQQDLLAGASRLGGIDPASIVDRAALAKLAVLRKSELTELQAKTPPFGGLAGANPARAFMLPGPIFEPQSPRADAWGFARALYAAGFSRG